MGASAGTDLGALFYHQCTNPRVQGAGQIQPPAPMRWCSSARCPGQLPLLYTWNPQTHHDPHFQSVSGHPSGLHPASLPVFAQFSCSHYYCDRTCCPLAVADGALSAWREQQRRSTNLLQPCHLLGGTNDLGGTVLSLPPAGDHLKLQPVFCSVQLPLHFMDGETDYLSRSD